MITGEPIPVEKTKDSKVTGGTVNGTGSVVMKAERVGSDTLWHRLSAWFRKRSAAGRRFRDHGYCRRLFCSRGGFDRAHNLCRLGLVRTEPALAYGLLNAVGVLIIACPCALGLATPMSIMVGVGRGATAGVLIKNAEALEVLEKIDTLVVDKTGTLTEGKPHLAALVSLPGQREDEILRLAASLERASEHPLAADIVGGAEQKGLKLAETGEFRSITGKGVIGVVDGKRVALGNLKLLEGLRVEPGDFLRQAETLRKDGQTVMYIVADGAVVGLVGVADPVKPSAAEAIQMLHQDGIRIVMLTGDNRTTSPGSCKKAKY